jgi:hypothetical protein
MAIRVPIGKAEILASIAPVLKVTLFLLIRGKRDGQSRARLKPQAPKALLLDAKVGARRKEVIGFR